MRWLFWTAVWIDLHIAVGIVTMFVDENDWQGGVCYAESCVARAP